MSTRPEYRVNPFLHNDSNRVYNPLTDRSLEPADPLYDLFRRFERGDAPHQTLISNEWIIPSAADLSRRYFLKVVSLETITSCNQRCYFCPVSVAPRDAYSMPSQMFDRIVGELAAWRETLEGVFLQNYNEPTLDLRFVEHCLALFRAGLPVAVLTNGSGLTPAKADQLLQAGALRYLCVNLSTLDELRYKAERGEDHVGVVLRNLDYLRDKRIAEKMTIVVLGTGDQAHQRDHREIAERFSGSFFDVQFHRLMDRAGWLDVGLHTLAPKRQLAGCDNVGSRPLQHLHITPEGKCVLCCEDYDERYVVGDLNSSTIAEVLEGQELSTMRRWVYGLEQAPEDFMCRNCIFARTRDGASDSGNV